MKEFLFEIENLAIGYDQVILEDLNLVAREGEFIPVLGPNGIGKTTLIKTIFQLIDKKSGTMKINGEPVEDLSRADLSQYFSVSLSEYLNTGLMSCWDFVYLGTYQLKNKTEKEIHHYVESIFSRLGIEEQKEKAFSSLSDGQKEWVKLARVLAQDTQMIFLDEPMSHLDISGKVKMMHVLEQLAIREKKCILMSSHDWATIRKFSKQVFVITEKGKLFKSTPEDLILNKELNKIYSLQGDDFFEDNQGEISIHQSPTFTLKIELESPSENCKIKLFWLKQALEKLGFTEDNNKNDLGTIQVQEKGFVYQDQEMSSVLEVLKAIQKRL